MKTFKIIVEFPDKYPEEAVLNDILYNLNLQYFTSHDIYFKVDPHLIEKLEKVKDFVNQK